MAKMTADQLIDAFKELTLIELSDFVKKFEQLLQQVAPLAAQLLKLQKRRTPSTSF
jgi:large subunit ribosomal protein L7/L12